MNIRLGDDLQPQSPVTVTATLPRALRAGEHAVLVTRHANGPWQSIPMGVAGTTAKAQLSHLSPAWVVLVNQSLLAPTLKFFSTVLGQTYPKPDCANKPATAAGATYRASVSGGTGLYACTATDGANLTVTVHSNSPFVWVLRPSAGAGQRPVAPMTTAGEATALTYDALVDYDFSHQTAVVPGGTASLVLPTSSTPATIRADVDPVLGYVAILVAGLDVLLAVKNVTWAAAERAAQGECLASAVEAGVSTASLAERAGQLTGATFACLAAAATGAAAVLISIVGTLSGLLVAQLRGVIGELTGSNHLSVAVRQDDPLAAVRLGPNGAISVNGRDLTALPAQQAIDALTAVLGPPQIQQPSETNSICDSAMIEGTAATFGDLRILIPSRHQPPQYPATYNGRLAGWELGAWTATRATGLRTARGVRLGDTFTAVQRAYPGASLGLYDGARVYNPPGTGMSFLFPPNDPAPLEFIGSGLRCGT